MFERLACSVNILIFPRLYGKNNVFALVVQTSRILSDYLDTKICHYIFSLRMRIQIVSLKGDWIPTTFFYFRSLYTFFNTDIFQDFSFINIGTMASG